MVSYSPASGALFLVLALTVFGVTSFLSSITRCLSFRSNIAAVILMWIGAFAFSYGIRSVRAAAFSLLFLLFMVPAPLVVLDAIVYSVQKGSAVAAYALFRLLDVPILWHGFKFTLPGVEIEIAKECSGIRSCTALFMAAVLSSNLFLQSAGNKILFCALTIPVAIVKNAIRIVTISWLGA